MQTKGNPFALLEGMQTGEATVENSMDVPQKIKNRTAWQPSNWTTKYVSKGYKNADLKEHMHPNIYSITINNSQIMQRAQMSTDCWMDKEVVYVHNGIYLGIKKNEILPFATWMELECITLSEIS